MTEQLKPCPFCGGEPILHDGKGNPAGEYWVGCKCDTTAMSAERAIQLWNTRQSELPSVEKIEEIIDQPIREYNMERLNIKGLKQAIAKAILEQGIKVGE